MTSKLYLYLTPRHILKLCTCCLLLALLSACGTSGGGEDAGETAADDSSSSTSDYWQPTLSTSWHWQLTGSLNTTYDVAVYDVDLEETTASTISDLHAAGHRVICYFSAGSYEAWRADAADFDDDDLGNDLDGWDDERWLDVTSANVRTIMEARLDTAAAKGCDGVEPDNVDGYSNSNGLGLTAANQLDYNRFLANAAHQRGLAVGLKNDLEQVADLVTYFDFAVNEQCHQYAECDQLIPFTRAGKPVFNAEYANVYTSDAGARAELCEESRAADLQTLILPEELDDSFRYSCDD